MRAASCFGFALFFIICACERNPALAFVSGYEICTDGIDNDNDGRVDFSDRDCAFSSNRGGERRLDFAPRFEEEIGANLCNDNLDNDRDGKFDCGEKACSNVLENCCFLEVTDEQCSDGIDNDNNGYTDCRDYGCKRSPFVTVCKKRNYYSTSVMANSSESDFETCTDGIDNDGNGFIDCDDFSCKKNKDLKVKQACQESLSDNTDDANARCEDGEDNDADGYVDCADWDCSFNPDVTVCSGKRVCAYLGGA